MDKIDKNLQFKHNPRKITDSQIERLEGNLLKFGDLSGVVYCQNNKAYVGGNQRSKIFDGAEIAILEKFDKPKSDKTVVTGFVNWNGNKYLYREVQFTEEEFREACIIANAGGGTWDYNLLKKNWDRTKLKEWGVELENKLFENKRETYCNLKEKLSIHKKGEFYCVSFWKSEEEGEESERLTEIKSNPRMINIFADKCSDYISRMHGKNLKNGNWCIITAPKRRHKENNFASEVCKIVSKNLDIKFYEDLIECKNRQRINPDFSIKYKFPEKNVFVFDDIVTTGPTLTAIYLLLKNDKNLHFIAGINNNA
jgi:hypoxanthine phosphoribosyltransferase